MKAPLALSLWASMIFAQTVSAQTMDVHVNQSTAFVPMPGGGIITGVVDLRTTVQFPEGRNSVVIGGRNGATSSTSSRNPGTLGTPLTPGGHTLSTTQGGGGYTEITYIPVPVVTGPEERPLDGVPGRELVKMMGHADPSDRLSAVAEIARRPWNPKAKRVLTRNVGMRLGDEAPRVAAAAAGCLARLGDAEAPGLLMAHLKGRESARLVPLIEALAQVGDASCQKPLSKLADHIDLDISLAASRALTALERRLRAQAPRSAR